MGAPSISLRLSIERLTTTVNKVMLSDSALFIVPSLATTLAPGLLFWLLKDYAASELNAMAVVILSAVILSMVGTAAFQFLIYKKMGEDNLLERPVAEEKGISTLLSLGIMTSVVFSILVSGVAYPYFKYVLNYSALQFLFFSVLLVLYSVTWILTASFWAAGKYRYPAFIFAYSYVAIFVLSYSVYQIDPTYTLCGYIAGMAVLVTLLTLAGRRVFGITMERSKLLKVAATMPKLFSAEYWGILFQTFFIIAVLLDKVIVWISEGAREGSGLQVLGPYTTGAFLGLIPTLGIAALAQFTEKVKPSSKDMYKGTLSEIRRRISEYKSLYREGLVTMLAVGLVFLAVAAVFAGYQLRDTRVLTIVLTIGFGALFFEVVLYNSFVLPIFGKSQISTISVLVVCMCEVLTIPFISNNMWYASLGFLVGSIAGFMISHSWTTKLLSNFDYNAFRAFQAARQTTRSVV
jgi:uncharacterized membrane protein